MNHICLNVFWWASWGRDRRTLIRPSEKRISIVSFRMGSRPPWWIPIPLFNNGSTCSTLRMQRPLIGRLVLHLIIKGLVTVRIHQLAHRITPISSNEIVNEKAYNPHSGKVWCWVGSAVALAVAVYPLTAVTSTRLVFIMWLSSAG